MSGQLDWAFTIASDKDLPHLLGVINLTVPSPEFPGSDNRAHVTQMDHVGAFNTAKKAIPISYIPRQEPSLVISHLPLSSPSQPAMGSNHPPIVDLTDDSDPNGIASVRRNMVLNNHNDRERQPLSSYLPSSSNPAKRSKIDASSHDPRALLNPRAFVDQGGSLGTKEIASFPSRAQQEMDRTAASFNKRMEVLHGIKDRKAKAPSTSSVKRSNGDMQDRSSGYSLVSKDVVTNGLSGNVIDLTGTSRIRD